MIAFASPKICQRVADMSMTSHFHEFLNFIFGGILLFGTTVGLRRDSSLVSNIVHLADSWCSMKLALVDSLDT